MSVARAAEAGVGSAHTQRAGLYVHAPFCSAICPYCDFAVRIGSREARRSYVDSVVAELELVDDDWSFDTVYLGGGTPSALEAAELGRLFDAIGRRFPSTRSSRVFLEANPEDVHADSCAAWRSLGVTTLSLGVQSFNDGELRFLGRRHTGNEAREAVETALAGGFDCVSVDLIFGLPESAGASAGLTSGIETLAGLGPQHVSAYQLGVHDGTVFGRRRAAGLLEELPDESRADVFRGLHEDLSRHGFEAYEVSSFATARRYRSSHNSKYWKHVPYLGLGPSAHSFRGRRRWWNERELDAYSRCIASGRRPVAGEELLSRPDLALETLMLRLRTIDGLDTATFFEEFGIDLRGENEALVRDLVEQGRMEEDGTTLRPTINGLAVADGIAASFSLGPPAPREDDRSGGG